MKRHSFSSRGQSVWVDAGRIATKPALKSDLETDVCVIGAGMAGMSTAYKVAQAGLKVVVLDDGRIGGGQTECTTAHLSNMLDRRYTQIEAWRGAEIAALAAGSHTAAIQEIESIATQEQIECDFRRVNGYLFAPPDQSTDVLDRELAAILRTGAIAAAPVECVPWPDFNTGPCLLIPQQGQFHPLKYLKGLTAAIKRKGGKFFGKTHVTKIKGGSPAFITTESGPVVTAKHVVVATNSPVNDWVTIHTKQAPYMTYVVGGRIPKQAVPEALYWDTADPYHYVRLQDDPGSPDHAILIVGGEDHKTGQADDGEERFARLQEWAEERFSSLEAISYHWSGQVMESVDGLAFIGHNPLDADNVYIATGDSGLGMTHGTIAGILISDLILGRENRWREVYDPARTPISTAGEFLQENLNVALQYAKWLVPGEVPHIEELPAGHGAVMQRGLSKCAVYRDAQGQLTELSAVCPHLQCAVAWNPTESTWDCPCHGSRFDPQGKVLNGPANQDLSPWKEG